MMSYKNSLSIILFIIILFRIALPILGMEIDLSMVGLTPGIVSLLNTFSDLIVMGYLFYFVRYVKKQKIWIILAFIWIFPLVYGLMMPAMLGMAIDVSHLGPVELYYIVMIKGPMEGLFKSVAEIILGILLILNQLEGASGKNIRLVGVLMVACRVGIWLIAIVIIMMYGTNSEMTLYVRKIFILSQVLVYAAMARMYQQERKSLVHQ